VAEKALRETSDPVPWQIVESTDARYRDLTVARAILTAVKQRLSSSPPTPTARAAASVVPDVLARVDLSSSLPREEYRERLDPLQARLLRNVRALKDQGTSAVLVFEGWDAAGKGGCIRRLTRPLDPADYRLLPISAPSDEERARHYLWRFWRRVPAPGQLAIFDRSWYGRVLVERVEGFASEAEWRRALAAHRRRRAATPLRGARRDRLQEVQADRRGLPKPREVAPVRGGRERDVRAHEHRACAVAPHTRERQALRAHRGAAKDLRSPEAGALSASGAAPLAGGGPDGPQAGRVVGGP
jgi:polyphosphate kinase 2 (PPK2 family)